MPPQARPLGASSKKSDLATEKMPSLAQLNDLASTKVRIGQSFGETRLQLLLLLLAARTNGLHQTEARLLHGLDSIILLLRELLVCGLELLHLRLEFLLSLSLLLLLLLDLGIKILGRQSLEIGDLLLLVVVAEVNVGRRARRLELLGELLQLIE